jgi:glycosyltransferase involved in cell wall biosynthesis
MTNTNPVELSVVVPLFNEEQNAPVLYEMITRVLHHLGVEYEIIFVDDGSLDKTFAVVAALTQKDTRLRVIKFRRNYGQTPAMQAGIDHSRGDIIVTMDGDLQNDPEDIPRFIETLSEDYDIVVGWRHKRQDKLITRKIPSKIANWVIGKVTGVPIKDNGCSLKAYRARVIKSVSLYSEMHRFIPALTSITGARIAEIKVKHHARRFGVSKYGLSRIYKVLIDLLTIKTLVSFSSKPSLWFAILAIPLLTTSLLTIGPSLFLTFVERSSSSLTIAGVGIITAAGGLFLILLGFLGELVYKTGELKVPRFANITARVDSNKAYQNRRPRNNSGVCL